MDLLFGGGDGQSSQLSLATAYSSSSSSLQDLNLISAAAAAASGQSPSQNPSSSSTSANIHFNGHDNGPMLYDNLNRTSAIDDIRSVVIYIFIITIFLSFFLILPGIRNEKFPTFLCVTTSLFVTSIIIISLNGTTWHVGEAPISAPYKAFSRDRIQGDLSVRIGLQSVNISLYAHKYYILHATNGPMIMENTERTFSLLQQPLMMMMMLSQQSPTTPTGTTSSANKANSENNYDINNTDNNKSENLEYSTASDETISGPATTSFKQNLADELLAGRTSDGGLALDAELEVDEPFSNKQLQDQTNERGQFGDDRQDSQAPVINSRRIVRRSSLISQVASNENKTSQDNNNEQTKRTKRQTLDRLQNPNVSPPPPPPPRYTIKRVNVDINYNERFYWIGPMQMRQEYQHALERGLPYPILTCVEYLSQDDAGFSWSRQYRAAGYYTTMLLWFSLSVCLLMFCLHCAAPKYGIYTMQVLGLLLLCTNFTYATLVPRGNQKLVIPFEGQSVTFRLGWNFWLVLVGGCLSLIVGTIIVIIDKIFPDFIFTTVLDSQFDLLSSRSSLQRKHKTLGKSTRADSEDDNENDDYDHSLGSYPQPGARARKPNLPPFMRKLSKQKSKSNNKIIASRNEGGLNDLQQSRSDSKVKSAIETKSRGAVTYSLPLGNDTNRERSSFTHEYESIVTSGRNENYNQSRRLANDRLEKKRELSSNLGDITTKNTTHNPVDKRNANSRQVSIRL